MIKLPPICSHLAKYLCHNLKTLFMLWKWGGGGNQEASFPEYLVQCQNTAFIFKHCET